MMVHMQKSPPSAAFNHAKNRQKLRIRKVGKDKWYGWWDLNLRPLVPQTSALTN